MQRARFFFIGDTDVRRRLSQLSSRISARLPQRRETVAVGPDQVVDLDLVQAGSDQQSAPRASGSNSFQRSGAALGNTGSSSDCWAFSLIKKTSCAAAQ